MFFDKSAKIYIAGHRGLAGSAICRSLEKHGYSNLITISHQNLDLEDRNKTEEFICDAKPDMIFLAAAKVGGIHANNKYPVDFLMSNLAIQANVIRAAYMAQSKRLIFLGSSCIYPKNSLQPIKEEYLLTSELESTNRPYALAKIAGIEMCWSYNRQFNTKYLAAMPTNLYGINDNYDLENSHVLPALLRKIHNAKIEKKNKIEIWGSGKPKREFLHSDDLAMILVSLMNLGEDEYNKLIDSAFPPLINIGSGQEVTILELAELISDIVGYKGEFDFDDKKPDGVKRKILDNSITETLNLKATIKLKDGIKNLYNYLCENRILK